VALGRRPRRMAKARPRRAPPPRAHRRPEVMSTLPLDLRSVGTEWRNPPLHADTSRATDAPWRSQDVLALVVRLSAAVAAIAVAVYQASGKATIAAQIPWANWAVAGFVGVGVANGLWLL